MLTRNKWENNDKLTILYQFFISHFQTYIHKLLMWTQSATKIVMKTHMLCFNLILYYSSQETIIRRIATGAPQPKLNLLCKYIHLYIYIIVYFIYILPHFGDMVQTCYASSKVWQSSSVRDCSDKSGGYWDFPRQPLLHLPGLLWTSCPNPKPFAHSWDGYPLVI